MCLQRGYTVFTLKVELLLPTDVIAAAIRPLARAQSLCFLSYEKRTTEDEKQQSGKKVLCRKTTEATPVCASRSASPKCSRAESLWTSCPSPKPKSPKIGRASCR